MLERTFSVWKIRENSDTQNQQPTREGNNTTYTKFVIHCFPDHATLNTYDANL